MEDIIVVKKPKLILKALLCEENKVVFGELMLNEQVSILNKRFLSFLRYSNPLTLISTGLPRNLSLESMLQTQSTLEKCSWFRNSKTTKFTTIWTRLVTCKFFLISHYLLFSVWGTWVIEYCVQMEKPLPTNRRLCYSFAFDGLTVLLSGFDTESTVIFYMI
jgi:hypothetical protein